VSVAKLREAFKDGWRGIYTIFKELAIQIKSLRNKVSTLETKNQTLETKNQTLETKNQTLETKNHELEEKLKKLLAEKVRDSHNSSKPPSTDGIKKRTKSLRKKSERKPGGQKGHEGNILEMELYPDKIEIIKLTRCHCCGKKVDRKHISITSRQVIDFDAKKTVIEYQAERYVCPKCQSESIAPFPDFCTKKVQYGPNVKALSVYLNKYQLVPLKRVREIFYDLFEIKISEGSIVNFNAQLFTKLEGFENECKESLLQSELIHSDESGGRCEKKLQWFQVVSNQFVTFFAFHVKRGTKAMNDIGILSKFKGKAVHDFYRSYLTFDFEHILCNAHLLRELIFEHEQNLQNWAGNMFKLLLEIKLCVDREKEKGTTNSLSTYNLKKFENEFDSILKTGFKHNPYREKEHQKRGKAKQSSSRNLLDRLREHKKCYLGFMYDFTIPFDNNLAERDIRMLKLYMKISGCFRTFSGAAYFCRIRSYISTVRKNNLNTFTALQNAFLDQPFSLKYAE
jgi:transposase